MKQKINRRRRIEFWLCRKTMIPVRVEIQRSRRRERDRESSGSVSPTKYTFPLLSVSSSPSPLVRLISLLSRRAVSADSARICVQTTNRFRSVNINVAGCTPHCVQAKTDYYESPSDSAIRISISFRLLIHRNFNFVVLTETETKTNKGKKMWKKDTKKSLKIPRENTKKKIGENVQRKNRQS